MKFALVSHGLPPSRYVQSVMIYRLLHGLNPDAYCLISQERPAKAPTENYWGEKLPAPYYFLSPFLNLTRGTRFRLVRWFNIRARAEQIARIIRREKCEAVVACTSEFFDLPASYLASRMTGVKFYPYLFDYYSGMAEGTSGAEAAHRLETEMMKDAAGVIVPNEFLRDELRELYGVEATVIRNPCDLSKYEDAQPYDPTLDLSNEIRIIYTGSIYHAHYSAFRNLLAALELLKHRNVRLHVYTNQPREELERNGIKGRIAINKSIPAAQVPALQQQADLLFLPLAFNGSFPKVIRTSAPGKVGEYLAARRPILVHVPSDSFLAWYFERNECGLVVTEIDPARLAEAIETALTDTELRRILVENAWERAQSDFSMPASQKAFVNLMKLKV